GRLLHARPLRRPLCSRLLCSRLLCTRLLCARLLGRRLPGRRLARCRLLPGRGPPGATRCPPSWTGRGRRRRDLIDGLRFLDHFLDDSHGRRGHRPRRRRRKSRRTTALLDVAELGREAVTRRQLVATEVELPLRYLQPGARGV